MPIISIGPAAETMEALKARTIRVNSEQGAIPRIPADDCGPIQDAPRYKQTGFWKSPVGISIKGAGDCRKIVQIAETATIGVKREHRAALLGATIFRCPVQGIAE